MLLQKYDKLWNTVFQGSGHVTSVQLYKLSYKMSRHQAGASIVIRWCRNVLDDVYFSHSITHTTTYIFHCRTLIFKQTFDKMWPCNFSPSHKLKWQTAVSHGSDYKDHCLLNVRLCGLVYTAQNTVLQPYILGKCRENGVAELYVPTMDEEEEHEKERKRISVLCNMTANW